MRFLLVFVGLALATPGRAADPPAAGPEPLLDGADGLFNAPARVAAPRVAVAPPLAAGDDDDSIRLDLVLGLPTAVRAQARLGGTKLWVEGGAAVYVVIPSVFVGLRYDGLLHRSASDTLLVRPGLDAYYVTVYSRDWRSGHYRNGVGVAAADFDLAWHHRVTDAVSGNVGLKLGCGVGVSHGFVFPAPILGVTLGLQF